MLGLTCVFRTCCYCMQMSPRAWALKGPCGRVDVWTDASANIFKHALYVRLRVTAHQVQI